MAHIGKLPKYQRLITTHNSDGQAIVSNAVDSEAPWDASPSGGATPFSLAYTTTSFPADLNKDRDVEIYKSFVGKPPGLVQYSGSVLRVVDFQPGFTCAMHRTISIDYGVVMIGEIELSLDSGETRIMKAGDICIQRGTMHAWRNTSQTEWARMLFVLQPCQPVEVEGRKLGEEHGTLTGVPKSS